MADCAKEGKLLPELIEELGNDAFLELEAQVNASLTAKRCVIATGGSAIYRGDASEKMKKNGGIVVYLKIPYEEVERLSPFGFVPQSYPVNSGQTP